MSFDYECPHCHRVLTLDQRFVGVEGLCPFCRNKFKASPQKREAEPVGRGAPRFRSRSSGRRFSSAGGKRGAAHRPARPQRFEDEEEESYQGPPPRKKDPMVFVIAGIGALVLIVGLIFIFSGRDEPKPQETTPIIDTPAENSATDIDGTGTAADRPAPAPAPAAGSPRPSVLTGSPGPDTSPAAAPAPTAPVEKAPPVTEKAPETPQPEVKKEEPKPEPAVTRPTPVEAVPEGKKKVKCNLCNGTGKGFDGKPCRGPCNGKGYFFVDE